MSPKTLRLRSGGRISESAGHGSDLFVCEEWVSAAHQVAGFYYTFTPVVSFCNPGGLSSSSLGFLKIVGWIPVKLLLFLCIGAVITIYK